MGTVRCTTLLACALLVATATAGVAALPGAYDPTFNGGAPLLLDLALTVPRVTLARGVVFDAAGRLMVTGYTSDENGRAAVFLARFGADGVIDGTFATGGVAIHQVGLSATPGSTGQAIGPRSGVPGWIVAGQASATDARTAAVALATDANGNLDLGFGSGGSVRVQPAGPAPQETFPNGSAVGPDGRSYTAGALQVDSTTVDLFVVAIGADGIPVASFGNQPGAYVVSLSESTPMRTYGAGILPTSSGLLVSGATMDAVGRSELLLLRLTAAGQLDSSFAGGAGFVRLQTADPTPMTRDSGGGTVAVGPDDEIYVAGGAGDSDGRPAVALTRFTPAGVLDPTFGTGGTRRIQTAPTGKHFSSGAAGVVVQADRRIVVAGSNNDGTNGHTEGFLMRLLENGDLDPSFGTGGIASVLPEDESFPLSLALAPDGASVIVAGISNGPPPSGTPRGLVARVLLTEVNPPPPPPPGGCAAAPSIDGARCRIALLRAAVEAALPDGASRRRLVSALTGADDRLAATGGLTGRKLRRKLKQAAARMGRVRRQLAARKLRRTLDAGTLAGLVAQASALGDEIGALRAGAS
ncbi:MAG TPA: hypothetical protein VMS22_15525 [Candidatus Eisenbacteria bacterium]|nr:hypothetical protein [Candidatus Eisenbacteria bacterium]